MDELERIRQRKLREITGRSKAEGSNEDWPGEPLEVTDASFSQVIERYPLVVVDCWAAWCAPCRMIAPVVEELAREYKGKIVFGKLDVDSNSATAMQYGIMSIPTLLVFKDRQLVEKLIGAMPRGSLEQRITRHL
ncbi:MAG: thioredoxin [Aigarchaeota archaeon]|nr:thioredoxin [Aigarchaeota archaeon]